MLPGVTDRILTVTGAIEHVLRAVALVATALSEDDGAPTPRSPLNIRPLNLISSTLKPKHYTPNLKP